MRSTKYSLIHHLKDDYEANGTVWSICIVNQQIVSYWRIYVKSSKKSIWTRRKLNINLVHHLWLDIDQGRIDQVLHLSILDIYGSNLTIRRRFSKNESIEDMKCCVRQDGNWRIINKDLSTMDHASEKSKQESWRWGTVCDREGQVDVQSKESSYPWRVAYHQVSISIESKHEVTWRSNVENWLYNVTYSKS
jgi:hypothetical protein